MLEQLTLWATDSAISSPASADGHSPFALPGFPMTVKSGPAPAHANHSAAQESAPAQQMNATSGPSTAASSRSAALQSALESKLRAKLAETGSPLYVLTWKHWDMQSGEPICALRASAPRRSDSASGGWQTPTTRDGKGQSGKGNRIKRGKNGRLHVANLCDQIVDLGRPDLVRSTSFRNWLMGYPESWEAARAMATPSSRKSRKPSSKP